MAPTVALPSGNVTLLFSDMEGSTRLLARLGEQYVEALDAQRRILRGVWTEFGGTELGTEGDSFYVVFPRADDAVGAASAGQQRLAAFEWPAGESVRVRMGMHTGSPLPHADAYVGMDVHRAARIAGAAHGGQVTMSSATAELVRSALPAGTSLKDLGEHRLKDLPRPERIYQLAIDGCDNDFPPLRALGASSTLPLPDAPLLGRETDLDALRALVEDGTRILTLTGPGGSGKTSLGIELARTTAARFDDGAYFVPLASVTEAMPMWTVIASTLGVTTDDDVAQEVCDFLAERDVLLLLDNLEQLVGADQVVERLLGAGTRLRVVATSRRPLHLVGEQEFPVAPLALPSGLDAEAVGSSPAVQLFVRHAKRVRPAFALSPETIPAVVEICRRVDGLPLAIELTAARSKLLSPQAILARLGSALEISAADTTRPARQRNLRATIEWSYRLLDPEHQDFFVRMGAFSDGADLAALEAVCVPQPETAVAPLDMVLDIVDASLATAGDGRDGEPRVTLLETVRGFAQGELERTDPEQRTREAHARHYLQVVRESVAQLPTAEHASARERLARERANIRAAAEWALSRSGATLDLGLELTARICVHWNHDGGLADTEHLAGMAVAAAVHDSRYRAYCMATLANSLRFSGKEVERRTSLAIEAVDMLRRLGQTRDVPYAAYTLRTLAAVEWERGDIEAARALYAEVTAIVREAGDPSALRIALLELGGLEAAEDRLDQSIALEEEAVEIATAMGDVVAVADSQHMLACSLRRIGRLREAEQMIRQVVPVVLAFGDSSLAANVAEDAAAIFAELGRDRLAARLIGAADGWHDSTGLPRHEFQKTELAEPIGSVRKRLPRAEWEAEYRAGYGGVIEDELARALATPT